MKTTSYKFFLHLFVTILLFCASFEANANGFLLATHQYAGIQLRYLWPSEASVCAEESDAEQMVGAICRYKMSSKGILLLIHRTVLDNGDIAERTLKMFDCAFWD